MPTPGKWRDQALTKVAERMKPRGGPSYSALSRAADNKEIEVVEFNGVRIMPPHEEARLTKLFALKMEDPAQG